MQVSEAIVEYIKAEIIPVVAGGSELTGAILAGALRAGRKRIAGSVAESELLRSFGIVDASGNADTEMVKDFVEGAFEGRDKISVSLAEVMKVVTGVDSSSELLQRKLSFSKGDADKFIELLKR